MNKAQILIEAYDDGKTEYGNRGYYHAASEKGNIILLSKEFSNKLEPILPAGNYTIQVDSNNRTVYIRLTFNKPDTLPIEKEKANQLVRYTIDHVFRGRPAKLDVNYLRSSELIQSILLTIPNMSRFEKPFSKSFSKRNARRINKSSRPAYGGTSGPRMGMRTMPYGGIYDDDE